MSELQKMKERHHEIARLTALGWSCENIAEQLGLQVSTVRKLLGTSTLIKDKVGQLSAARDASVMNIRKDFEGMAPAALCVLDDIITNPDGNVPHTVQLKAASYVLGVLGAVATKTVKHQVITAALPAEEVKTLIEQLKGNQTRLLE